MDAGTASTTNEVVSGGDAAPLKETMVMMKDDVSGGLSPKTPPLLPSQPFFDTLPAATQLALLALGVFVFFGVHNVLQEAMMKIEGFTFGVMLGWMEVLGVCVCSYIERTYVAKETGRAAPLAAYPPLTACLLASSSLASLSLNYINFPTKVVFRSCKLLPTMLIATLLNGKKFAASEYGASFAVCIGLVLFAAADWTLSTPSFHPLGLSLVSLSVCADAFLPNAQERLFKHGSSRLEVTFFTNLFTLICMTVSTLTTGDLPGLFRLAATNQYLAMYMTIYTFIAYIAVSAHMLVVKRFGGVAAVFVGTARKGMTLVLSFLLFPKEFSWYYVMGATLVLGGLAAASLLKQRQKSAEGKSAVAGDDSSESKELLAMSSQEKQMEKNQSCFAQVSKLVQNDVEMGRAPKRQ